MLSLCTGLLDVPLLFILPLSYLDYLISTYEDFLVGRRALLLLKRTNSVQRFLSSLGLIIKQLQSDRRFKKLYLVRYCLPYCTQLTVLIVRGNKQIPSICLANSLRIFSFVLNKANNSQNSFSSSSLANLLQAFKISPTAMQGIQVRYSRIVSNLDE